MIDSIIQVIGSIAGAFVGSAGNIAGAGLSYNSQKKLQSNAAQLNYDYSLKSARNMPSAQRQGLVNAGYNPMLAVQNGTSGANSSFTSAGSAPNYNISEGLSSGVAAVSDILRVKNETEQTDANVKSADAIAEKAHAEKSEILERLPFVSDKAKADLQNTIASTAKLDNDIEYQNKYLEYLENQMNLNARLQMMGLDVSRESNRINAYNASTSRMQYEIDKEVQSIIRDRENRYRDWGRKHPYARNVDETLSRFWSGFGSLSLKRAK